MDGYIDECVGVWVGDEWGHEWTDKYTGKWHLNQQLDG